MSPGSKHRLYPQVAGAASFELFVRGELDAAVALSRRATKATRPGDEPPIIALASLSAGLLYLGRAEAAVGVADETLTMAEASADPWVRVVCATNAIAILHNEHARSPQELTALASTALGIARRLGNPTALRLAAQRAGIVCSASDPALAVAYFEEALQAGVYTGADANFVPTLGYLSRCWAAIGDNSKTASAIRQGVLFAREMGSPTVLLQILDYGGQALVTLGRYEEGAVILAVPASGTIAPRAMTGLLLEQRTAAQTTARAHLGEERYNQAAAIGAAMGADSAINYTLAALDPASAQV